MNLPAPNRRDPCSNKRKTGWDPSAADSVAANFEQIFAAYSPNTRKEIL